MDKKHRNLTANEDSVGEAFPDLIGLLDMIQSKARENARMLEQKKDHFGEIILCHLVIESLTDDVLRRHLSLSKKTYENLGLRCYQKIMLLPSVADFFKLIVPGMDELNKLRNKIAHQLSYDVRQANLKEITRYLQKADQKDLPNLGVEQKVQAFTLGCIAMLSLQSEAVGQHLQGIRNARADQS